MSIRPHCRRCYFSPMDELAQARIQLVRLEQQERNLLGRLKDIRSAVQLQQATIDALVKSINCAPISRLPTELLLEILDLAINAAPVGCDLHLHTRKWELTCVSRRWRDVILNSPVLWTSIKLTPIWDVSVVKAHVTRSRGRPLDIEVGQSWPSRGRDALPAQLDVVVPSAHRWRSLVIHNSAGYTLSTHVLARIDNLKLSSLKHVSIPLYPPTLREQDEGKLCYPSFLRPGYISNLKSLELRNFVAPNDFQIPHGLTALLLKLPDVRPSGSSTFLSSLSSQTLKDLSLSGDIDHWSLQPDTIHLPFLEKLELRVSKAKGLLEALVAPRLINFEYHPYRMQDPPSVVFRGLSSKFRSVEYLSFHLWEILEDLYEDANAFYHWAHLESLTFKGLTRDLLRTPNEFFMWLEQRKARGKPMLHIKLSQIQGDDWGLDVSWLSTLYEALHNFSILEFEDVPLMPTVMLSGNVDSTLQLNMPALSPGLFSGIDQAFRAGHVSQNRAKDCKACRKR
ncbi:hypothetical protein V8B97DRAFT_1555954 [Scleroderma yunnanense]